MKWSYPIFRIFGIQVRLHGTFVILLMFVVVPLFTAQDNVPIFFALLFLSYFFIILLHELGHSIVAIKFGSKVRDITLLPIGGIARIEKLPEKPSQEILVAFAGPAVNIIFVIVIGLVLGGFEPLLVRMSEFFIPTQTKQLLSIESFLVSLGAFNIFVALFNLLPGFPMDGGRILRGCLSFFMRFEKATIIAVVIGRLVSFGFMVLGIYLMMKYSLILQGIILIIISLFLSSAGASEAKNAIIKGLLRGIKLEERMLHHPVKISPSMSLYEIERMMNISYQSLFPVVENGYFLGFLTRDMFFQNLRTYGYNHQLQWTTSAWVVPGVDLYELLIKMTEKNINFLAVTDWFGRYLGIFNSNDAQLILKNQLEKKGRLSLWEHRFLSK